MGSYSTVVDCELTIIENRAKAMREWLQSKHQPIYVPKDDMTEYDFWKQQVFSVLGDDDDWKAPWEVSDAFSDKKIIGYWYEGFCYFLRDFAQFVEGYITWQSEDGEERVLVRFDGRKPLFENATWRYTGKKVTVERYTGKIKPLPKSEEVLRSL